jgi:PAS domain-containing protein
MSGDAGVPDSRLIGTFSCDPRLNITSVNGRIIDYLDCLPSELKGHGWRPFIPPADFPVTEQMVHHLNAGLAGAYDIRAQARCGEPILHLRIRTLLVRSADALTVRGVLDLRHTESRRKIVG